MPFQPYGNNTYNFTGETWNDTAGVYGTMDANRHMIYIGETDSFKRRLDEHQRDTAHAMHRYRPTYVWVEVISAGEVARLAREQQLIAEYAPPANR